MLDATTGQNGLRQAKVFSDASALARSLAEARDRNSELAVEAVMEATSFTAEEAVEKNIVDLVADNLSSLLEQLEEPDKAAECYRNGVELPGPGMSGIALPDGEATQIANVIPISRSA